MKTREEIQSEAVSIIIKGHRVGVNMSVGSGKTLVGLMYIDHFFQANNGVKVLIAAPTLVILESWKKEIIKHGFDYLTLGITYTTYRSLDKQDPNKYDILICDEAHNLLDSHRNWLNFYGGKILGLSGTMPKYQHSEKGQLIDEFCPVVYNYTTDDAVEDQILNDYRIIVHELELSTSKTIEVRSKTGTWLVSEKANYEYWTGRVHHAHTKKEEQITKVMRMRAIMGFKTKETYAKKLFGEITDKVILFCNTQDQADRLCKHSYHSNNPLSEENLDKFSLGEITKLTAVQQLNEGVNIPGLKQIIILHSFSSSSPKSHQKLGRCVRLPVDQVATIHIMVYKDCIDETWVNSVLSGFDESKISYKLLSPA